MTRHFDRGDGDVETGGRTMKPMKGPLDTLALHRRSGIDERWFQIEGFPRRRPTWVPDAPALSLPVDPGPQRGSMSTSAAVSRVSVPTAARKHRRRVRSDASFELSLGTPVMACSSADKMHTMRCEGGREGRAAGSTLDQARSMLHAVFLPLPATAASARSVAAQRYAAYSHPSKGSTDGARLSPQ